MFKSANQAKREIEESRVEKAQRQKVEIQNLIEKAIIEEQESFYYHQRIMPSVMEGLEEAGYLVTESNHRNELTVTISM